MLTAATSSGTSSTSYEERINQALTAFLHSGTYEDMKYLEPFIRRSSFDLGPQTPADELIAEAACITLLRRHDSTASASAYVERCVLTGLLANDRWKTLLSVETDAYNFGIMLIRYLRREDIRKIMAPYDQVAHRVFRFNVHAAMAPWLPSCIELGDFSLRDLASAFFGEAWCTLVYDERRNNTPLAGLIADAKPEFLPGRLTYEKSQDVHPLPELTR